VALFTATGISCKKEVVGSIDTEPAAPVPVTNAMSAATTPNTRLNSSWSLNWNNYADGIYTGANASTDFGNASGWTDPRAWISAGTLRVRLQPKALSSDCGIVSNIEVVPGAAYEVDYYVRFHSQFDWGRGGKLGFGFLVGNGNTGGIPAWDGNGGSMRLIWYQTSTGRVVFQPYLYYKDQPGQFGDNLDASYPASGTLEKAKWYHVQMYIKSNTGSETNGRARIVINGTVLLDKYIRWTTNDSKRLVRSISFHTFRGGNTPDFESSSLGYIYYDNLKVTKIH
jgi:hypothetical protein